MDFHYRKINGLALPNALSLEWLETNNLGGYSSSTITNCHTRKYHGLLVSPLNNLPDKYVLLSKVDDFFCTPTSKYPLTDHHYRDIHLSESFSHLTEFALKTHPIATYKLGDFTLSKEILMPNEENAVLIKYKLLDAKNSSDLKVILRPMIALRNFHKLTMENPNLNSKIIACRNGQRLTPYVGLPTLFFQTDNSYEFLTEAIWYKNFSYMIEKERGFQSEEDLFTGGVFTFNFDKNKEIIFSCGIQEINKKLSNIWQKEINRRIHSDTLNSGTLLQKQLKKTASSFLKKNIDKNQLSIVAGYHWFLEWGRDTMISLPGLTLYAGMEKEYLAILQNFSKHERNGIIPNYLGITPEQNAYNSVDASLWFAWSIQQYYLKTKDLKSIKPFWPTLKNIFTHYKNGTSYDIKMNENGLISTGTNNQQNLTWMDSMVNGVSAVKRNGVQVEVNALWYNMLNFLEDLGNHLKDDLAKEIKQLIPFVKNSFCETFWDEKLGALRDFINPEDLNDPMSIAIRPNQIFAVSLPYSPLTRKMMTKILEVVRIHLLTPYGLRSLAPSNPSYIGTYAGGPEKRDLAYHNGTVWPWLLGAFTEGLLKVLPNKKAVLEILKPTLEALAKHLQETGIGTISEIFSGDAPHKPNGCISQAWSIAEVLRITYLLDLK